MNQKNYYTAWNMVDCFRGVVYHYDAKGNNQIPVWQSGPFDSEEEAIDAAAEFLENTGLDAELE